MWDFQGSTAIEEGTDGNCRRCPVLSVNVRLGCCVNNVLINSVKCSKCLDFETLLRKSCSLNSESKSQVICGCEKFSLERTASFSVKILFNRQIFRTTQFRSRGGCCVRLTSVFCAYFSNRNSFPRSCSWKVQTSEPRGNWDIYGTPR